MKATLTALLFGAIFGAGLAVSGMSDRQVVLGFLDVFGQWNPALIFVMAFGLIVSFPIYIFARRRVTPLVEKRFFLPDNTMIDKPLVIGSLLFGIGWGLYGYCPGPAITAVIYGHAEGYVFVVAMLTGLFIPSLLKKVA